MRFYEGKRASGPFGTAVECRCTLEPDDPPGLAGTVAMWLLDCPGQSPAWSHYSLSVVHLRPIPGADPAEVTVPGATHQFALVALNPDYTHDPLDPYTWARLTPHNLEEQVEVPDDEGAWRLALGCVHEVVNGRLWAEPPFPGTREPWLSALVRSAAHLRGEPHAPHD